MTITTEHAASSYGIPVILDDDGTPLDTAAGVKAARRRLGLSAGGLAEALGKSRRTVEGWEGGRPVPRSALLLLAALLRERGG